MHRYPREGYSFVLETFAEQPQEAERVVDHLLLLKWGLSQVVPGQDPRNVLLPHMQTCLYDLLQLKPVLGLNFDRGNFFVDWNYLQTHHGAPDHVVICDTLRSSEMTGQVAVETLRYAATLVQHLLIHLHDHILQQEASYENGLFDPTCDTPFDILWKQLAVGAGSKLTQAINRIRYSSFPPHLPPALTSSPHLLPSPPPLTSSPHLLPSPPPLTSSPHLLPSPPPQPRRHHVCGKLHLRHAI
jgi:hypothetical protein